MATASTIHVELIERAEDIPLSADAWNELAAANATNSIFQTREWFDAWWRSFGSGHRLFFLLLRRADEIVGFAPLMVSRVKPWLRQVQFVGTGNADYLDFVIRGERRAALDAILDFLRRRAPRTARIHLSNVPVELASLDSLSASAHGRGLHLVDEVRLPCLALSLEGDSRAIFEMINKYSMRRPLNWFRRRGVVRFRHVRELDEVLALLPVLFDQHRRRWRAAGCASLFEQPLQRAFYASLAASMHRAGWLLFSVVELDSEPIAIHFGFDYAGTVMWYKPSFETKYAEHSPGVLLIRELIADALVRGRREIDFTIGEERFKERFANLQRTNAYAAMYRSRAVWLAALGVRSGRRLAGEMLRFIARTATLSAGRSSECAVRAAPSAHRDVREISC